MIAYNNAKLYIGENQNATNSDTQSVIYVKIKGKELKNLTTPVTYTVTNIEVRQDYNISKSCIYHS